MRLLTRALTTFLLILFTSSCQTNKIINLGNSDFEKIKTPSFLKNLGDLPMVIEFEKAFVKRNSFYATGYIFDNSMIPLKKALISINKGGEKKKLYETKEDGFFEINVDNFSQYDILEISLMSYISECYDIHSIINQNQPRKIKKAK